MERGRHVHTLKEKNTNTYSEGERQTFAQRSTQISTAVETHCKETVTHPHEREMA